MLRRGERREIPWVDILTRNTYVAWVTGAKDITPVEAKFPEKEAKYHPNNAFFPPKNLLFSLHRIPEKSR